MAQPEITVVSKKEDLPGSIDLAGDSIEDATQGLFDALAEDEDFAEETESTSGPEGDRKPAEEPKRKEAEAESEDEDDDADTTDNASEDEAEESEDETDEDESEEDGDEGEADDADLIEVTLPGGEKIKVTREEAAAGYSRTQDYTRKRQADAEEHRQAMTEVREIRSQYAERLEKLQEVLEGLGPKKPDDALRKTNPGEWAAQMGEYQAFQESLGKISTSREVISEEERAEQMEGLKAAVQAEWEKMVTFVPEWKDEAKANEDLLSLRNFAMESYGFNEQEIDGLVDHRLLRMLRDVHALQTKRESAKDEVEKKKAKAKAKLEPGSSDPTRKSASKTKKAAIKQANERAAQSGSVTDAAKAIELILSDED